MEGTVDIKEFIKYLEENDLVITHRSEAKQELLKARLLKKKWITYKEIADSKIWKVASKNRVEAIVKEQVDSSSIDNRTAPFKIHRLEVERIGKNRGTL